MSNLRVGILGEKICALYLERLSYKILFQNWHCHWGELDLVCEHTKRGLVFVEVKTVSVSKGKSSWHNRGLSNLPRVAPEEQFTYAKRKKLYRTITIYLAQYPDIVDWSVDLVCVVLHGEKAKIKHYKNVSLF